MIEDKVYVPFIPLRVPSRRASEDQVFSSNLEHFDCKYLLKSSRLARKSE